MKFIIKPKPDLCESCVHGSSFTVNGTTRKQCDHVLNALIQDPVTQCSLFRHMSMATYSPQHDDEAWVLFNVDGRKIFAPPHERRKYEAIKNELSLMYTRAR